MRSLRLNQFKVIALLFAGYAALYFCRADLSVGSPLIIDELGRHGVGHDEAVKRIGDVASFGVFAYAVGKLFLTGLGNGAFLRQQGIAPVVELDWWEQTSLRGAQLSFTPAQQQAAVAAFTKLTIASYAHNFSGFSGEHFELDPNVATRGPDKIVTTHLIRPNEAPVALIYRMRLAGDSWKVIDIFYGAISQLTTRRSDFAASIASGGAPALIAHLNALSDKLMS